MSVSLHGRVAIVIPARYGSSRLRGKPLIDIGGKPMIQHVYESAENVENVQKIAVATDDKRIKAVVEGFGGHCIMTSIEHSSGTDRLTEVMKQINADIYINLQGDKPLVKPEELTILIEGMLADESVQVGILCYPINSKEAENPNTVKVVIGHSGDALYFSRSPVPYSCEFTSNQYWSHVGIYGYRRDTLEVYAQLPPSKLEKIEKLEQLRLLDAGIPIKSFEITSGSPGVDTPACLERVRAIMTGKITEKKEATLEQVKLVITDIDGVLTDGSLFYDQSGEVLKRFHVRDGLGIRMLEESGVKVVALSGKDSLALRKRLEDLNLSDYLLGIKNKYEASVNLIKRMNVSIEEVVCIGDDTIDLPMFEACGMSFTVEDAPDYIKQQATHVLLKRGGEGAFRELADLIIESQQKECSINASSDAYKNKMHLMEQ